LYDEELSLQASPEHETTNVLLHEQLHQQSYSFNGKGLLFLYSETGGSFTRCFKTIESCQWDTQANNLTCTLINADQDILALSNHVRC